MSHRIVVLSVGTETVMVSSIFIPMHVQKYHFVAVCAVKRNDLLRSPFGSPCLCPLNLTQKSIKASRLSREKRPALYCKCVFNKTPSVVRISHGKNDDDFSQQWWRRGKAPGKAFSESVGPHVWIRALALIFNGWTLRGTFSLRMNESFIRRLLREQSTINLW